MLVHDGVLQFVLILPARCGTTSVKTAVREIFQCSEVGANHGLAMQPRFKPFYKVCLRRHPFPRVVSMWQHWLRRDKKQKYRHPLDRAVSQQITIPQLSFSETVCNPDTRNMLFKVCQPVTKLAAPIKVDRWIQQEKLREELEAWLECPLELPHKHKSPEGVPWHSHYSPEAAEFVRKAFAGDFERFDYSQELPDAGVS